MQYFVNKNNPEISKHKPCILSRISVITVVTTFSLCLLFSASAMAGNASSTKKTGAVKVSQQHKASAHVSTHQKKITAVSKNALVKDDSKLGAYSLSDGAQRGAYGDGIYSNAD